MSRVTGGPFLVGRKEQVGVGVGVGGIEEGHLSRSRGESDGVNIMARCPGAARCRPHGIDPRAARGSEHAADRLPFSRY